MLRHVAMGRFKVLLACCSMVLAAACVSTACAQNRTDLASLVNKVDPCVVTILLDNQSEGSGFLVDGKGIVVTNYHVVEGAKSATVVFADKKTVAVTGFLAVNPAKDLALIQIPPRSEPYPSLKIAANQPSKGDRVFAFGAPMGLSGSVSDGIVAAIRPGTEVRETLEKLAHRDVYTEMLRYDLDAQWIQSTAPISPGNSGGPLVDAAGEVVGVNTWVCAAGQSLSFSLSAVHLRPFVANAGGNVQSFSLLPAPRPGLETRAGGNAEKTMVMWKAFNRSRNELEQKTLALEKKLQQIVPIDPNNPRRGENTRNRKKVALYEELAKIYREHADNVKALDNSEVDSDAAKLAFTEAELSQRTSDACQELSNAIATDAFHGRVHSEWSIERMKDGAADLRTLYDLVRIKLNRKYSCEFPTVRETAKNLAKDSPGDALKTVESSKSAAEVSREPDAPSDDKLAMLRVWTDRSGQYQVQAKCRGVENGRVKLEKADGAIVYVPLANLSEADQRFIGLTP